MFFNGKFLDFNWTDFQPEFSCAYNYFNLISEL